MYKENRVGPKTDPCGRPQQIGAEEEEYFPIAAEKDLSDRYDLNHDKTVSLRPKMCSSFDKRML